MTIEAFQVRIDSLEQQIQLYREGVPHGFNKAVADELTLASQAIEQARAATLEHLFADAERFVTAAKVHFEATRLAWGTKASKLILRDHDDPRGCPKCGHKQILWSGIQPNGDWHGRCPNTDCGVLLRGNVMENGKIAVNVTSFPNH